MKATKIFVVCPGGVVTGGPEVMHQLVFTLRALGKEAYISYYPFDKKFISPKPYEIYNAPQALPEDHEDNLIVLAEIDTIQALQYRKAQVGIWWLSVDNYFSLGRHSLLSDIKCYLRGLIKRERLRLGELRQCFHFCQSAYAGAFLSRHNLTFEYLTDYLNSSHFETIDDRRAREDVIMYNPRKGVAKTRRLIAANPQFQFRAIENMTPAEVRVALLQSKIYVDLGHHPGKDRLPREAAMAGCCVITGKSGSAKFHEDVPILDKYKLNDNWPGYIRRFAAQAREIFQNFEDCSHDFDDYRIRIRAEQKQFEQQVKTIFCEC